MTHISSHLLFSYCFVCAEYSKVEVFLAHTLCDSVFEGHPRPGGRTTQNSFLEIDLAKQSLKCHMNYYIVLQKVQF